MAKLTQPEILARETPEALRAAVLAAEDIVIEALRVGAFPVNVHRALAKTAGIRTRAALLVLIVANHGRAPVENPYPARAVSFLRDALRAAGAEPLATWNKGSAAPPRRGTRAELEAARAAAGIAFVIKPRPEPASTPVPAAKPAAKPAAPAPAPAKAVEPPREHGTPFVPVMPAKFNAATRGAPRGLRRDVQRPAPIVTVVQRLKLGAPAAK